MYLIIDWIERVRMKLHKRVVEIAWRQSKRATLKNSSSSGMYSVNISCTKWIKHTQNFSCTFCSSSHSASEMEFSDMQPRGIEIVCVELWKAQIEYEHSNGKFLDENWQVLVFPINVCVCAGLLQNLFMKIVMIRLKITHNNEINSSNIFSFDYYYY